MENSTQPIGIFVLLFLCNAIIVGCIPSIEESSTHFWLGGGRIDYCGAHASPDVYGFNLHRGQETAAPIWIVDRASQNGIQAGWHVSPELYNDSHTHFYTAWTTGTGKSCTNMLCPGFHKISSSIAPGMILDKVSRIHGPKWFMTLRVFKEKSSGDWHVYLYKDNGIQELVGYFPKYLVPGLINKQVEISFGGYVYHKKPQPSPPMGSGYVIASRNAASFNILRLIDAHGNDHVVNTDLPSYIDGKGCYTPSHIDASTIFFYGVP
ncbi:uncharacterized protein LOC123444190 isoform X1 [Hordeum vulgare subsp. vulgare]|nr:uncharacterized protein LOC123444190 isoform X1 [Hordeum vulgare subsp. vulgare]